MLKIFIKILLLVFFATVMFFVFSKFFSLMSFTDPQMPLGKGDNIKLRPQKTLVQEFVASHDNLVKIEFLLRIEGINDGDNVKMQLTDETCSNIIREGSLASSAYLASGNLFEFKFDKIPDSNGKTFCIKATFETQNPQAKYVQFFSQKNDSSMLSIRPAYENDNWKQDISELNQRISQYKPWFLKHFYLYAISFLFLFLSVAIVVILILV